MHVVRGREADPDRDREWTQRLLEGAAEGTPGLRVWVPPRQVAFGRRDRAEAGYERARKEARQRGFDPFERRVGGRAVAFDGETTVTFIIVRPADDSTIADRYDRTLEQVEAALESLGIDTERGEPTAAFCPGSCSLHREGRKLVGLAQRVTAGASLVAGVCLLEAPADLTTCLEAVYETLELPFDPTTVGGVSDPPAPGALCDALETALRPGEPTRVTELPGQPS